MVHELYLKKKLPKMMKIKKAGKPGIMVYPNIQEAEAGGP
jgi:hypothetical protein